VHVNDHGVLAAAGLGVILMLSACSSGAPSAAHTPRPSGAGATGMTPKPTASPAARLAFSRGQESARIGPYTQVYVTPMPANAAQARVIKDFRTAQILWGESNEALRPVTPVLAYVTGIARRDLMAALAAGRTRHLLPAGTERFFRTRVAALSGSTATVTTCDDASKYREQNPRTGKINSAYTPNRHTAYTFETWHLALWSGRWTLAAFSFASLPDSRALPCQP
jgi:hypothetical protein